MKKLGFLLALAPILGAAPACHRAHKEEGTTQTMAMYKCAMCGKTSATPKDC